MIQNYPVAVLYLTLTMSFELLAFSARAWVQAAAPGLNCPDLRLQWFEPVWDAEMLWTIMMEIRVVTVDDLHEHALRR